MNSAALRRTLRANRLLSELGMADTNVALAELVMARKRIAALEDWIKSEGERNDTCTFSILGKICEGCRCGKASHLARNED